MLGQIFLASKILISRRDLTWRPAEILGEVRPPRLWDLAKILLEILSRFSKSFWPPRFWDLGEKLGRSEERRVGKECRSRWDLKISAAKNSPRFSPRSRRDLKISSRFSTRSWRDLKISAAKNPPRFSPRSQNLVEILGRDLNEISKSRQPKIRRESRQDFK